MTSTTFDDEDDDDHDEHGLKVALMRADLELKRADFANKQAETAYKQGLARYEPWKVVLAAFTTGAAFMGAIAGILAVVLRAQ